MSVPVSQARDCAALAPDVTMGVLFTRGPILELDDVRRLCTEITVEAKGIIAPSARLGPNAVLLLGQHGTVERFRERMSGLVSDRLNLRINKEKWPPLHTPIVWERQISNKSGLALYRIPGGFRRPTPDIISCVTGERSYTDFNSRELLTRWIDHPQLLWDAMYEVLQSGIDLVIHVGPEPNLIPSTFERLSSNVRATQLAGSVFRTARGRLFSVLARNAWLMNVLPSKAALLRAPYIQHVILEDWLLEQDPA